MKCFNCGQPVHTDNPPHGEHADKVLCKGCADRWTFNDQWQMVLRRDKREPPKTPQAMPHVRAPRPVGPPELRKRPGDQPLPIPNENPSTHDLAIARLQARKELGLSRYGSLLQGFNGRSFLKDLIEELIDAVVYAEGKLFEEEHARMTPQPGTNDRWLFTDHRGDLWRLIETGDPHMPLRIEIQERHRSE
jgi:hypothetical protein